MFDLDKSIREKAATFPTLKYDFCTQIILCARGMSVSELYDHLMLDPSELTAEENLYFQKLHKHGLTIGVKEACDNLFLQMRMRGGGEHALQYLSKQASGFKGEISTSPKGVFKFQIVEDED